MFSEYVVRAVVAERVSQLRQEAAAEALARTLSRAASRTASRTASGTVTAARRRWKPAFSRGEPQPCGC